jgi:acyl-CoA reductase-like NAD-dependent aldehyde dehydrogenase
MMMERIPVLKTYKLYIGGQFPRTESGRFYAVKTSAGKLLANACLASRKDFRNAVVAARTAFGSWCSRSPFNRSQILYRLAEMMESRKSQLTEELKSAGYTTAKAEKETDDAIDLVVHYSGWCDKYHQFMGTVNPVSSSHFNFSSPEAMGVMAVVAPEEAPLVGLLGSFIPAIAGGNTAVVLASEGKPLVSMTLAEIIHASDFPAGVINILTGQLSELHGWMASHMDVNALICFRNDATLTKKMAELASANVKRTFFHPASKAQEQTPYRLAETQEIKTTWHPIENIGGAKAGY